MAIPNPTAEHDHLGEPCLHQPAAVEAGGVAVGGHLDRHVEAITLPDTGRQVAMHPDQRRGRRGKQRVGLNHTPRLHVGQQGLPPGIGRRITAGAGEARDEGRPFDALRIHAPGNGVVADEPGLGLDIEERLDLGALAADGRAGAADEHDDQRCGRNAPGLPAAIQRAVAVDRSRHRICSQGKLRHGSVRREGRRVGVAEQGVKGAWNCGKGAFFGGESSWPVPAAVLRSRGFQSPDLCGARRQ